MPKGQYVRKTAIVPSEEGTHVESTTVNEVAAVPPTGGVTLTQEQFDALLRQASGNGSQSIDLLTLAKAIGQANRVENPTAPMVSVYNPKGDRDHPKPKFAAHQVIQNGIRLQIETLNLEEVAAVNVIPPGKWLVHKANDETMPLTVEVEIEPDGTTLHRKCISFPCKSEEQRYDHRSLFDYTLEALELAGKTNERDQLVAMRCEYNALRVAS